MPRKVAEQANSELEAHSKARIRYLLRNPVFQKDFNELRNRVLAMADVVQQITSVAEFENRWRVYFLSSHPMLFQKPHDLVLNKTTIPEFERLLTSNIRSGRLVQQVSSFNTGDRLWISIDLAAHLSVDSVLGLIEAEIRQNYPKRQSRQRLDSLEFQLEVFDLVIAGKTFDEIARKTQTRPSTVKSAFSACTPRIFGEPRSKKDKRLYAAGIDNPSTHIEMCVVCKKAFLKGKNLDDFCPEYQAHVDQDYVPQRERTGYDTTERSVTRHRKTKTPLYLDYFIGER